MKKTLLNQLLAQSIQSALDEPVNQTTNRNREDILAALSTNDHSLEIREKELGVNAKTLEADLFRDMKSVIEAILENNNQTIIKFEKEQKMIEQERSSLGKENKLSGYINQQKSYQNDLSTGIAQKTSTKSGTRLLDGTL